MVIERFTPETARDIYRRVREGSRLLPDGLRYVDSWVWADLRGCFQVMECDDLALLQEWIARWGDLAELEVLPVVSSSTTQELMARLDSEPG